MQKQVISSIVLLGLTLIFVSACTTVRHGGYEQNPEKAAEINTKLGANYLNRGDLDLANIKLKKALRQNPNLPDAHATFALLQTVLGDYKLAEKHYRKALRLEKNNPQFLNNYGRFLCDQGRHEEAEKKFLAALKDPLYKTPEYAYTNAGECALKVKNYDRAESYFRKALQENSQHSQALYHMARLNNERRNFKLAETYLKRYHELDKRNQTAESLYLAVQLAKKLRNNNDRASYSLLLKNNFPDSEQAQRLRAERD